MNEQINYQLDARSALWFGPAGPGELDPGDRWHAMDTAYRIATQDSEGDTATATRPECSWQVLHVVEAIRGISATAYGKGGIAVGFGFTDEEYEDDDAVSIAGLEWEPVWLRSLPAGDSDTEERVYGLGEHGFAVLALVPEGEAADWRIDAFRAEDDAGNARGERLGRFHVIREDERAIRRYLRDLCVNAVARPLTLLFDHGLSVRAYKILTEKLDIHTVEAVRGCTNEQLLAPFGFGETMLDDLDRALAAIGLMRGAEPEADLS